MSNSVNMSHMVYRKVALFIYLQGLKADRVNQKTITRDCTITTEKIYNEIQTDIVWQNGNNNEGDYRKQFTNMKL